MLLASWVDRMMMWKLEGRIPNSRPLSGPPGRPVGFVEGHRIGDALGIGDAGLGRARAYHCEPDVATPVSYGANYFQFCGF